jgi:hypothetical protein
MTCKVCQARTYLNKSLCYRCASSFHEVNGGIVETNKLCLECRNHKTHKGRVYCCWCEAVMVHDSDLFVGSEISSEISDGLLNVAFVRELLR